MFATDALRRISPFGPIFGKELRVSARRKRSYWLRVLYLGGLLLFLVAVYESTTTSYGSTGVAARNQQMAMLGVEFFACFSFFSIFAMGLIGPILTCTAIGGERLHKTLPVLLMTPISAWQIVAGKLFSRSWVALTLLGLSLPVLALVRLLGGVELEQMVAVVCIAASIAMASAAVGLFFSTLTNRAYAVILVSYAVLFVGYLFVPMMGEILLIGPARSAMPSWLSQAYLICSPYILVMMTMTGGGMMLRGGSWHTTWIACVGLQLGIATALLFFSAMLIRRASRRDGERRIAEAPAVPIRPVVDVGIDGTPRQAPQRAAQRSVGDNPIIWREMRRPIFATVRQRVIAACACIVIVLISYWGMAVNRWLMEFEAHSVYAVIFHGLTLVMAAVLSATAIAQEKESDTWTLLLATPISGSAIVWGKALGVLRRLIVPMGFFICHFLLFTAVGVLNFAAVALFAWVMFSFNSLWIATGIYLSVRLRKVTAAVIVNLMLAVVLYLVVPIVMLIFGEVARSDGLGEQGCWPLPFYYLVNGMRGLKHWHVYASGQFYSYDTYNLPYGSREAVSGLEFFVAVIAVGVIYLTVSALILRHTARRFDHFVARAPQKKRGGMKPAVPQPT